VVDGGGLENVDDRLYQDGYIFRPNFTSTCAKCGRILRDLVDFEPILIIDPPNFGRNLLISDTCHGVCHPHGATGAHAGCFGFDGFCQITRRQQTMMPVMASIAGTRPITADTSSLTRLNLPKCSCATANNTQSTTRSCGSRLKIDRSTWLAAIARTPSSAGSASAQHTVAPDSRSSLPIT
jgi:hypothetical protein